MMEGKHYCGQIIPGKGCYGLAKKIDHNVEISYKGQIVSDLKFGFGEITYADKTRYQGFFWEDKKQGIGKTLNPKTVKQNFHIYDNDKLVRDLTEEEVNDINSGKLQVKEMEKLFGESEEVDLDDPSWPLHD